MGIEHYLFHVLGATSESRVKFVDFKGITFTAPGSLLLTVLRR